MKVFAYCCASFAEVTRQAAGVTPMLSPPVDAGSFDPVWLEGWDVLWFDLHGEVGTPWWWGDERLVALTAEQIRQADLGGTVVFAVSCHLADEGSLMLEALLDAGARYVIGGQGRNWGGRRTLFGAGLLGMRLVQLMDRGMDALEALAMAKRWLRLGIAANAVMGKRGKVMAAKDALGFRAFYRDTDRED